MALAALPSLAHERSVSYSTWDIRGRSARITARLSRLDLTRLPWAAAADVTPELASYVVSGVQLLAGDTPCAVSSGPHAVQAAAHNVAFEWQVRCPDAGPLQLRSDVLFDVAPSHLHFARLTHDGSPLQERILSEAQRTWTVTAVTSDPSSAASTLIDYIALGMAHIWSGYDHLIFLLALLLLESRLAEVAKVVTGFTVAHSITLGLSVLGYVRPEPAAVEALIGLSIALIAAENMWLLSGQGRIVPSTVVGVLVCAAGMAAWGTGQVPALTLAGLALFSACYFGLIGQFENPAVLRWAIAFIFGLVHGFGFAAVLTQAQLPPDRLGRALFGFNAGVEVGQLAAIALAWPLLHFALRRGRGPVRALLMEAVSAIVLAVGVFWFVSRGFR